MTASAMPSPQGRIDAWLAVNYALIFPGLGQIYSRHRVKGSLMTAGAIALLAYGIWSIFGTYGNTLHGLWSIAGFVTLYGFSILDAYRGTQPGYATRISVPRGGKNVWYAVFLSQILPGLGHLYLQRAIAGGVWLLAGVSTALLAQRYPIWVPIPPAIWALSCYHVHAIFPHRPQRHPGAIALLMLGLLIARLALGSAPGWIQVSVEQCIVPSQSMAPTLRVNDRLFVHRDRAYRPHQGDIVVFEPPAAAIALDPDDADDTLYVKRLIGLPGQQIVIRDGQVFVNDRRLHEPYVRSPPAYNWGPATVPPENYFVLGDNRNQSSDSHLWGYVPADHVLGNAYKIYWPPDRIQPLAR